MFGIINFCFFSEFVEWVLSFVALESVLIVDVTWSAVIIAPLYRGLFNKDANFNTLILEKQPSKRHVVTKTENHKHF